MEQAESIAESRLGIGLCHIKNVKGEVSERWPEIVPLTDEIWVGADLIAQKDILLPTIAKRFISLSREVFQGYH